MDKPRHQLNLVLKRLANSNTTTLRLITKYFDISISQLLRDESTPPERLTKTLLEKDSTSTRVPNIPWDKITNLIFHNKLDSNDISGWVSVY